MPIFNIFSIKIEWVDWIEIDLKGFHTFQHFRPIEIQFSMQFYQLKYSMNLLCRVIQFKCHAVTEFHFKSNLKIFVSQKVSHVKLLNQPIFCALLSLSLFPTAHDTTTQISFKRRDIHNCLYNASYYIQMNPSWAGEREREKESKCETVAFVEESFSFGLVDFSHAKSAGGRPNQTLRPTEFSSVCGPIDRCMSTCLLNNTDSTETTTKQKN